MRRGRWVVFALAGLAVLVAGALFGWAFAGSDEQGAESPEAAVHAYVAALNEMNADRLEDLVPPEGAVKPEIDRRMAELGGQSIVVDGLRVVSDVSPKAAKADVTGRGARGPYAESLTLTRHDDRWFVAVGGAVPSGRPTAATDR